MKFWNRNFPTISDPHIGILKSKTLASTNSKTYLLQIKTSGSYNAWREANVTFFPGAKVLLWIYMSILLLAGPVLLRMSIDTNNNFISLIEQEQLFQQSKMGIVAYMSTSLACFHQKKTDLSMTRAAPELPYFVLIGVDCIYKHLVIWEHHGLWHNIQMSSRQYRESHFGDLTTVSSLQWDWDFLHW